MELPRALRARRGRGAVWLVLLALLLRLATPVLHTDACHRHRGAVPGAACCHHHAHGDAEAVDPAASGSGTGVPGSAVDVDGGAAVCGCVACEIELATPGWPLAVAFVPPIPASAWQGLEPAPAAPAVVVQTGRPGARAPPAACAAVQV